MNDALQLPRNAQNLSGRKQEGESERQSENEREST